MDRSIIGFVAAVLLAAPSAYGAPAQPAVSELIAALKAGGCVVVMRHASSPAAPPSAEAADPENTAHERQLDEAGRRSAAAFGAALKALRIPVGEVWSSPTYRALQTVRLAGLPSPHTSVDLGDGGQSMQAAGAAQTAWLRAKAAETPRPGTDTLVVTHNPNIQAAFGAEASGLADGEALVFRPSAGAAMLLGRIKIEAWPALAQP